ncbi:MAG: hypothetical protein IKN55_06295 [Oscillospiraceae bacterium]|nr:hypothetical protein [Oscillospiraceae bacterium]
MEDLFERVYRYASEDADGAWGYDWQPQTIDPTEFGGILSPRNTVDDRRVYVYEYLYRKQGHIPSEAEEAALLAEKEAIADRIRTLNQEKSAYVYRADYCAVKKIPDGGTCAGYDFVIRHKPCISLAAYQKLPDTAGRFEQILHGTGEEDEKVRHAFVTKLLRHLVLGLKDIHRLGGVHGHINPDTVWLDEKDCRKEEFQLCFPGAGCFLRSAEVDRESIDEYAAPELCLDPAHPFDLQTDLYSVGLLVYRFLNGGDAPFGMPQITAAEEHKRRRAGDTEIPAPKFGSSILKYIARKLLAFERENRYRDFEELEGDLRKLDNKVTDFNPMSVVTVSNDRLRAIERTKDDNRVRAEKLRQALEGILHELDIDESVIREELGKKGAQKFKLQDQLARIAEGRKKIRADIGKAQADIDHPPAVALPAAQMPVKTDYVEAMSATKDDRDLAAEREEERRRIAEEEARARQAELDERAAQAKRLEDEKKAAAEEEHLRQEEERRRKEEEIKKKIAEGREGRRGILWWLLIGTLSVAAVTGTLVGLGMLRNAAGYAELEQGYIAAEISTEYTCR